MTNKDGKNDGKLHLCGPHYCEGIKQMVSHFIGAVHSDDLLSKRVSKIYIAPILFDFNTLGSKELEDYDKQYNNLFKGISKLKEELNENKCQGFFESNVMKNLKCNNPFDIILSKNVFKYQQFFKEWLVPSNEYQLDQSVRDFYRL